jgi:hypothetical protein
MDKYSILGVYPGTHECYESFKQDIRSEGISGERFQATDSEENVAYFYTEWVAFPIMYIVGIREWYDRSYIDYMEKGEENLHIEKYYHKYDELIAISRDDLNRYLEAYETLILGFILGIIDIAEEKERRTFQYSIQWEASPGFYQQKKLGDEYFAIKRLEKDTSLRVKISDMIMDKKVSFESINVLSDYYILINYYWKSVFPLRFRGSKADPVEMKNFEHRVIETEMFLIGSKIKEALKLAGYTEEQIKNEINEIVGPKLSRLDDFSKRVGESNRRVLKVD